MLKSVEWRLRAAVLKKALTEYKCFVCGILPHTLSIGKYWRFVFYFFDQKNILSRNEVSHSLFVRAEGGLLPLTKSGIMYIIYKEYIFYENYRHNRSAQAFLGTD
jgi:hypothetical protein